jgi:hypothetical protein
MEQCMEMTTFIGFYFIENDPNGYIDSSFGLQEDISNYRDEGDPITMEGILGKFNKPLILTRDNHVVVQKFIVDNALSEGTQYDLSLINTGEHGWDRIFNIAHYIYSSHTFKTAEELNAVLSGVEDDTSWSSSLFAGYIDSSVAIVVRADDPTKLERFSFSIAPSENEYAKHFTMYVNPEAFYRRYVSENPYIYVYYTLDSAIDRDEQIDTVHPLFENIGRKVVNHYREIFVPVNALGTSLEPVPFHIFSNFLEIPEDPTKSPIFLEAIKDAIREKEPELNEEQLATKYPTIFVEESRVIWPLFDNHTIKRYQIPDPITGTPLMYMANPLSFRTLDEVLSGAPPLQYLKHFEMFTLAHHWVTCIAAGNTGALTDRIPKYRPLLEDIGSETADDEHAKSFLMWMDKVISYILGNNLIDDSDKDMMGFNETTSYVAFKAKGIEWRVYKRGYETPFDEVP